MIKNITKTQTEQKVSFPWKKKKEDWGFEKLWHSTIVYTELFKEHWLMTSQTLGYQSPSSVKKYTRRHKNDSV